MKTDKNIREDANQNFVNTASNDNYNIEEEKARAEFFLKIRARAKAYLEKNNGNVEIDENDPHNIYIANLT